VDARSRNIPKELVLEFSPEFEKYREDLAKNVSNKESFNEYDY